MTDKQPEALRLAEKLEGYSLASGYAWHCHKAAAELRQLHAENEALRAALAEQPAPPPECQTEAEKTAFAFGWFKAMESVREKWVEQPAGPGTAPRGTYELDA